MKTRQLSVLAIVMATGCAHSHGDGHRAHAADEHRREQAARAENGGPDTVVDEHGDRVAVPEGHKERGHLASTGQDLPADKANPDAPAAADSYGAEPTNTRVNERDRASSALTPMDQSESESDRDLVQRIRKSVIADDSLSFTAKNVKIITRDGQVTLRGPVNNAREKATIEKAARDAVGAKRVDNELEVAK